MLFQRHVFSAPEHKALEIIEIYKRGTLEEQNKVIRIMRVMDPSNAPQYAAIK